MLSISSENLSQATRILGPLETKNKEAPKISTYNKITYNWTADVSVRESDSGARSTMRYKIQLNPILFPAGHCSEEILFRVKICGLLITYLERGMERALKNVFFIDTPVGN